MGSRQVDALFYDWQYSTAVAQSLLSTYGDYPLLSSFWCPMHRLVVDETDAATNMHVDALPAAGAADLVTSASQRLQLRPSLPTALSSSLAAPLLDGTHRSSSLGRAASLPSGTAVRSAMGPVYSTPLGYSITTSSTQNRSAQQSSGAEGGEAASAGLEGWDSLFARRYKLMMALAVGLPLLQQASGINTVVYYSSKVRLCAAATGACAALCIQLV